MLIKVEYFEGIRGLHAEDPCFIGVNSGTASGAPVHLLCM